MISYSDIIGNIEAIASIFPIKLTVSIALQKTSKTKRRRAAASPVTSPVVEEAAIALQKPQKRSVDASSGCR